jgi:predicted DNA-binding transcriptional regulator AlpA
MNLNNQTFLLFEEVLLRVRFSRATLYREMRRGAFPKPVRIARNRIAWIQAETDKWAAERANEREPRDE